MTHTILVVEDDVAINKLITATLQRNGYETLSTSSGQEALKLAYQHHPDLVCLDIMLQGLDGWEVCKRLRQMSDIPIIMLTARDDQEAVLRGLALGADDYLRKPFSLEELQLRIEAILRRTGIKSTNPPMIYDDGFLRIDFQQKNIYRQGQLVHLSPTEYRLLELLVSHSGTVVVHKELLTNVWGEAYQNENNCISLYIRYLRKKLEKNPRQPEYICTAWGRGYWFEPH